MPGQRLRHWPSIGRRSRVAHLVGVTSAPAHLHAHLALTPVHLPRGRHHGVVVRVLVVSLVTPQRRLGVQLPCRTVYPEAERENQQEPEQPLELHGREKTVARQASIADCVYVAASQYCSSHLLFFLFPETICDR